MKGKYNSLYLKDIIREEVKMNNRYIVRKPRSERFVKDSYGISRDSTEEMSESLWDEMDKQEYSEMPGLTDDKGIKIIHKGVFYHIPFECLTRIN